MVETLEIQFSEREIGRGKNTVSKNNAKLVEKYSPRQSLNHGSANEILKQLLVDANGHLGQGIRDPDTLASVLDRPGAHALARPFLLHALLPGKKRGAT